MQDEHERDVHGSQGEDANGALQKALDRCVSCVMPHRLMHMPSTVENKDTVLLFMHLMPHRSKVEVMHLRERPTQCFHRPMQAVKCWVAFHIH